MSFVPTVDNPEPQKVLNPPINCFPNLPQAYPRPTESESGSPGEESGKAHF